MLIRTFAENLEVMKKIAYTSFRTKIIISATIGLILSAHIAVLAQNSSEYWWEKDFIIGTFKDPPIVDDYNLTKSHYAKAKEAGFNLFSGEHLKHYKSGDANTTMARLIHDGILSSKDYILFNGHHFDASLKKNPNIAGRFYMDEPRENSLNSISTALASFKKNYPDKLFYVNLLPSYGFRKWSEFENYCNLFAGENLNLPVVCFDNYYQNILFSDYDRNWDFMYYSNLALFRKLAGNRPLWSTIKVTEDVIRFPKEKQKAYIRLGAFAPIAYGCMGLMYFCYDPIEVNMIKRDYEHSKRQGWKEDLVYKNMFKNDNNTVFFGFLSRAKNTHPDIAIWNNENNGSWLIATPDTTYIAGTGYKVYNNSVPFIADFNQDGYDDLCCITGDGRLMAATTLGRYTDTARDKNINNSMIKGTDYRKVSLGDFDGNGHADLCIAWDNKVTVFHDLSQKRGADTWQFKSSKTHNNISAIQTIYENGGLYIVSNNNASDGGYKLYVYSPSKKSFSTKFISGEFGKIRKAWIEKQGNDVSLGFHNEHGNIFYGKISNSNTIEMAKALASHDNSTYLVEAVRNRLGTYDIYAIPNPNLPSEGIVDRMQQTTIRYDYAKEINRYINDILKNVILRYEWKGCYHSERLSDIYTGPDNKVDFAGKSNKYVTHLPPYLMTGVFERDNSLVLTIVNKYDKTITRPSISIKGKWRQARMEHRIDNQSNKIDIATSRNTTELGWENITGGECIVIRLTR